MSSSGSATAGRRAHSFGIVVINWNNAPDTVCCVDTLSHCDPRPDHVVIVDNGSVDGSAAEIEKWIAAHDEPTALIRAGSNLGFAGGSNLGLSWLMTNTASTHLVLLNNDATLSAGFFSDIATALEQIGEDSIVGPTIYEDPDRNRVWYAGAKEIPFRALVRHTHTLPESPAPRPTDFVSGCVMVISRSIIETIGVLAECYYPAYFEDGDFCQRALKAGFPVVYAPVPVAYHRVGSTVRAANIENPLVRSKNRLRVIYVRRNYTGMQKALALSYLAVTKVARSALEIATGNPRHGWAILSGASAGFAARDIGTR